jgi:hypothetical protein
MDRTALEQEHAENFAHGRAFVSGVSGYELFTPCRLVIEHPDNGQQCDVDVEVVMVLDEGIALQFRDRSSDELERVNTFISNGGDADNHNADALADFHEWEVDLVGDAEPESAFELGPEADLEFGPEGEIEAETDADVNAPTATEQELEADTEAGSDDDQTSSSGAFNPVLDRQQRLRKIDICERMRIAHGSNMDQRILLERIYGAGVWEALLHNPKITVPEVARIAKKGTISRPLIDFIADNQAWVNQSIVRRALLGNPRLGPESALKVLRTLPQRELKMVPHQRGYPAIVRSAAAKLIKS